MATLSLTNTFIAGTLAKASEVNQNNTDIINWSSGNIQNDNLGTMSGAISWSITTGVKAISIANSGNDGSVSITQSASLNPNKSDFRLENTAAQTAGNASMYLLMTSSSSTIPLFQADYAGSQVFSIKKDRIELPSRTLAQESLISGPSQGSLLYNSTTTNVDVYTPDGWVGIGNPVGTIIDYAGSSPPDGYMECDGSPVSRTGFATLFAAIGVIWGVGDGSTTFNIPDLRRRTTIGSGGTQIAGPGITVGSYGGHEQLQSHSHSGSTGNAGGHGHSITDPGHIHTQTVVDVAGPTTWANVGSMLSVKNGGTTQSSTTDITIVAVSDHTHPISNTGSGNAENMQPSAVVKKLIRAF